MARKKVLIRIVNKTEGFIGNLGGLDVENAMADEESAVDFSEIDGQTAFGGEDGELPNMLETEAELEQQDGRISLRFFTELLNFPARIEYSFDEADRSVLTVQRKQLMDEVYFFSTKKKRQTVVYGDGARRLDFSVYTKRLKNHLSYEMGGFIDVEYYSEVKGGVIEHCREYIFVEPSV